MLVPIEWIRGVQGGLTPTAPRPERAFTPDAAATDEALARGERPEGAAKLKVELQVRRVAGTGPLAGDHIPRLMELLSDMNALVEVETTESGRRAVREHHAAKIAQELGRLDAVRVARALETLETQLTPPVSSP